jgi:ferric-dicitrate binding protein FerR (iron transport regulator)
MRKTDHRNRPRQRGSRATALLLATLLAVPAFGGQKPETAMLWETFVRQKPGTPVALVLHDGTRVEGRLLGAEPPMCSRPGG